MNYWVKWISIHIIFKKIFQTIFRDESLTIHHDRQTAIQVTIVPHHFSQVHRFKCILLKNCIIRNELDIRPVLFICLRNRQIFYHFAANKRNLFFLPISHRINHEMRRQGVNGFRTYTIQTNRLLKCLRIVFTPSIDF